MYQKIKTDTIKTYLSDNYHLGAGYCTQCLRKVGERTFVHANLNFSKININELVKNNILKPVE
jgi:hypothetical protein